MKKKENEVRGKMIVVRMNEKEYKLLEDFHQRSTHKYLSAYARKVLLQKPVIIKYRNQSADAFLKEMLVLTRELNAIGNNFNQAVNKLHMLDKIPEFRTWLLTYDNVQRELMRKIEEVRMRMDQLYKQMNTKN